MNPTYRMLYSKYTAHQTSVTSNQTRNIQGITIRKYFWKYIHTCSLSIVHHPMYEDGPSLRAKLMDRLLYLWVITSRTNLETQNVIGQL